MQISWHAQRFAKLEVQISWQVQDFVNPRWKCRFCCVRPLHFFNREVSILWQTQKFVFLEVQISWQAQDFDREPNSPLHS